MLDIKIKAVYDFFSGTFEQDKSFCPQQKPSYFYSRKNVRPIKGKFPFHWQKKNTDTVDADKPFKRITRFTPQAASSKPEKGN